MENNNGFTRNEKALPKTQTNDKQIGKAKSGNNQSSASGTHNRRSRREERPQPFLGYGRGINKPPSDDELMTRWLAANPQTLYSRGAFRRYSEGVWRVVPDGQIEQEIFRVMKQAKNENHKPNSNRLSSILRLAKVENWKDDDIWDCDLTIVVCQNGVLNLKTGRLRKHSEMDYASYNLPYSYNPAATCPAFDKAISVYNPEERMFLQEYAGLCLTPEMKYELALWLYGPPGSGKSTFIEGILTMLGDKVGNFGIRQALNSRFSLTDIPGKTAVTSTEQPFGSHSSIEFIKSFISGEPIEIERKYKDLYTFKPIAKVIWGMNSLPESISPSDGIFRRLAIVESKVLDPTKVDLDLKSNIKKEGPGILNWAFAGLKRLSSRGGFEIPRSILQTNRTYRSRNDITAQFIEDYCAKGCISKTQSSELFDCYIQWCRQNGFVPGNTNQFSDDLTRLGFVKSRSDGRVYWRPPNPI